MRTNRFFKRKAEIIFLFVFVTISIISCNNNEKTDGDTISTQNINNPQTAEGKIDTANLPVFTFETETHDFGDITEGEKVSFTFKFKNTGKSNLVISSANASCGCTVPKWSKEPVAPGADGIIEVSFNSSGKSGVNKKTIRIMANTIPNVKELNIVSNVKPSKDDTSK